MSDAKQVAQRIQLVRQLSNELAAFLYQLPDSVWRSADQYASACEQWKVADAITHLITGANNLSMSIERAKKGQATPPMGYNGMDRQEELARLVALREAYFEDLFPEFNASCRRLNTLLVELNAEEYEVPTWSSIAVMPLSRLIDIRAMELAVHAWDVRYPFDRSSSLNKDAVTFLKGWLWRWLRAGFQKGDTLDSPVRYRFDLQDSPGEAYDVVVSGDTFRLGPSDDVEASVTFRCDSNTYILFAMGRLPFRRSVRRGRLAFEGPEDVAARFTEWFKPV